MYCTVVEKAQYKKTTFGGQLLVLPLDVQIDDLDFCTVTMCSIIHAIPIPTRPRLHHVVLYVVSPFTLQEILPTEYHTPFIRHSVTPRRQLSEAARR